MLSLKTGDGINLPPFFCVVIYMNYTDGKNRQVSNRETLASLIGNKVNNPFGTLDRDVFLKKLSGMTLEEKGLLCNKVKVRPSSRAHFMDVELTKAFDNFLSIQPIILNAEESKIKKVDYNNPPQSLKDLL